MSYEELLELAKKHSDHHERVQEFEPAIIESLKNTDPKYPALEIGNRDGGSAMLIAAHILKEGKGRKLYTVDVNNAPKLLEEWLPKLGVSWEHIPSPQESFIRGDSRVWGFVYLDADHNYETVRNDMKVITPNLTQGCLMAVDDVHEWPELPKIEGLELVDMGLDEGDRDWSGVSTKHHIAVWKKI